MYENIYTVSNPKERESIPSLAPSPLNNLKVNWLKNERKGEGIRQKIHRGVEVVLWCPKPKGRSSIPGWAASSFTLVSEWKKPIR